MAAHARVRTRRQQNATCNIRSRNFSILTAKGQAYRGETVFALGPLPHSACVWQRGQNSRGQSVCVYWVELLQAVSTNSAKIFWECWGTNWLRIFQKSVWSIKVCKTFLNRDFCYLKWKSSIFGINCGETQHNLFKCHLWAKEIFSYQTTISWVQFGYAGWHLSFSIRWFSVGICSDRFSATSRDVLYISKFASKCRQR